MAGGSAGRDLEGTLVTVEEGGALDISIQPMTPADHDEAMALWRRSPGIGLSQADEPGSIRRYLERNSGQSFTAREEGRLIGVVLCGHDGRRGYLHHLAVDPDHRGRGLGRELARRGLDALRAEGIDRCHLFVQRPNEAAARFWSRLGWWERTDIRMFSIDLPGETSAVEWNEPVSDD